MTPNSLGGDWGGGNSNVLTTYCMPDPVPGALCQSPHLKLTSTLVRQTLLRPEKSNS